MLTMNLCGLDYLYIMIGIILQIHEPPRILKLIETIY